MNVSVIKIGKNVYLSNKYIYIYYLFKSIIPFDIYICYSFYTISWSFYTTVWFNLSIFIKYLDNLKVSKQLFMIFDYVEKYWSNGINYI